MKWLIYAFGGWLQWWSVANFKCVCFIGSFSASEKPFSFFLAHQFTLANLNVIKYMHILMFYFSFLFEKLFKQIWEFTLCQSNYGTVIISLVYLL